MRVLLFSVLSLPFWFADGILLYTFPVVPHGFATRGERLILLAGVAVYLGVHFFLRKPERMYLWAHEFSHLLAAKLFLRRVHQFHISSRTGGKVVLDGTNVVIDLAPYILPLYSLAALALVALAGRASPWVPVAYLPVCAYLFTMHLVFSAEGFVAGQPDLRRNGRLFSGGLVLLFLVVWAPLLVVPGTASGWKGVPAAYREWVLAAASAGRSVLAFLLSLLDR